MEHLSIEEARRIYSKKKTPVLKAIKKTLEGKERYELCAVIRDIILSRLSEELASEIQKKTKHYS